MSWNHRVLKHEQGGEIYYQIHEVYYEDGKPTMCTENAISVGGDDIEELEVTLDRMKKCLKKPILNYKDF